MAATHGILEFRKWKMQIINFTGWVQAGWGRQICTSRRWQTYLWLVTSKLSETESLCIHPEECRSDFWQNCSCTTNITSLPKHVSPFLSFVFLSSFDNNKY